MTKTTASELSKFELNLLSAFDGVNLSPEEVEEIFLEYKLKRYGEDREMIKDLIFDLEKGFFDLNREVVKEYVEILYGVYNSPCKESVDRYKMVLEDIGFKKVEKYINELFNGGYISKIGDGYTITDKGLEMLKHRK
ncbi:conserved hypothetical protein [Methanococcus vannielii SB]|uniref:ArnR1-like winged helix-turn-helix domain-containing protein n=1 Tax=Methanococcus vannielii (strain ATCC 35089 / DSM 1224 / JCM 13029 / OCM 148 / SB) TaxID=406327 RepID=A6URK6_METVS|nr:winged helix-turn-helix domain-containing protein [Methanococcus vannielii]ABR55128.1 conserved hypothetical protein [Methanococcus vannielii SB]